MQQQKITVFTAKNIITMKGSADLILLSVR
jgi:hypothetical protein